MAAPYTYPSWWMTTCDSFDGQGRSDHEGTTHADSLQCTWDQATTDQRMDALAYVKAQQARLQERELMTHGVTVVEVIEVVDLGPAFNADGTPTAFTLAMFGRAHK